MIINEQIDSHTESKLKTILISIAPLFLFVSAILLTVWEINIFRKTFISYYIPILLWVLPGLLVTPFLNKSLRLYEDLKSSFWIFIFNIITWGGLTVFSFMAANYYFPDKDVFLKTFTVKESGKLAKGKNGCNHPYVRIEYKGATKELVFPCDTIIENKKTVDIVIKKGLFGFEIVSEQTLNSSADTDK